MAKLLYYSRTGHTRRLGETLGGTSIDSYDGESDYVLLTPSYGQPRVRTWVPAPVRRFLDNHSEHLQAVVGVGNRNFGSEFNLAAEQISQRFGVPVIASIDMVPTQKDQEALSRFL